MNAANRECRQSAYHYYVFVSIFTVALFTGSQSQDVVCLGSANKNSPPRFLCGVEVSITRMNNCSVRIAERLTFPHTVDTTYERKLRKVPYNQRVSSASVKRNGQSIDSELLAENSNDFVSLRFRTKKSTGNSTYEVEYMLSNGVVRFSRECKGTDGESFPFNNVIAWRSGEIEEGVDRFNVRIESEGRLSFVGLDNRFDSRKEGNALLASTSDVTDEIELYARERGTRLCAQGLVCQDGRGLRPWIIFLIAAGGVLALVAVIVVAWVAKKKFGKQGEVL